VIAHHERREPAARDDVEDVIQLVPHGPARQRGVTEERWETRAARAAAKRIPDPIAPRAAQMFSPGALV
jgi:hypothetical protein